ncbi:MAG: hypothetical protein GC164_05295 [Phycisphaera sp.]|nr:hypothetical protein [Phycisphaera sp.]
MTKHLVILSLVIVGFFGMGRAYAQSSSLYVTQDQAVRPAPVMQSPNGIPDRLLPDIAVSSYAAVLIPEPRQFSLNDLVTIIVRESVESDSDAKLDTTKEFKQQGAITQFPKFSLQDLINFQLKSNASDNPPQLDLNYKGEFKGDGQYSRKDSFTARITARIIDIKPNGTLVLEARKYFQSDKESLDMVLTGTCRAQDIQPDNTVLSTQLYDLRINKEHTGDLRSATKKGVITQVLEFLFNF